MEGVCRGGRAGERVREMEGCAGEVEMGERMREPERDR